MCAQCGCEVSVETDARENGDTKTPQDSIRFQDVADYTGADAASDAA